MQTQRGFERGVGVESSFFIVLEEPEEAEVKLLPLFARVGSVWVT